MSTAKRCTVDGRSHLNRAALTEHTGMSIQTQANLYNQRSSNGHPEGTRVGRDLMFDEQATLDWYAEWAAAKRANVAAPDRVGNLDELLDTAAATKLLGYTNSSTIRGWIAANDGYFPDPDDVEELPSGRLRRRWRRRTLLAFKDRPVRPGRTHPKIGK